MAVGVGVLATGVGAEVTGTGDGHEAAAELPGVCGGFRFGGREDGGRSL